jgi:hypothetical protein
VDGVGDGVAEGLVALAGAVVVLVFEDDVGVGSADEAAVVRGATLVDVAAGDGAGVSSPPPPHAGSSTSAAAHTPYRARTVRMELSFLCRASRVSGFDAWRACATLAAAVRPTPDRLRTSADPR